MRRMVECILLLTFAAGCDLGGCGATEREPEPATEGVGEPRDPVEPAEAPPEDEGERFQVFSYAVEAYGQAKGVWESREIDGTRTVRRAELTRDGDGLVVGTRDDRTVTALHVVDDVLYRVARDECRATGTGEMSKAIRKLPSLVPVDGVAVSVFGVLGDGVPESAAEPIEGAPDGGLAQEGYRFESDHSTSLYDVSVTGEVWLDAEERPVRSKGKLELEPQFGDEEAGTAEWSFAITPAPDLTIELPSECTVEAEQVAAMEELPKLEEHEELSAASGNVVYRAPGTVKEALSMYEKDLLGKGWRVQRSGQNERTGTFVFRRDDEMMTVIATAKEDQVTVILSHAD
ncbi:MAG: hypothetical protein ACOCV4_08240 [Myxococcota bacterium]